MEVFLIVGVVQHFLNHVGYVRSSYILKRKKSQIYVKVKHSRLLKLKKKSTILMYKFSDSIIFISLCNIYAII